jgi:hypothetical protein
MDLLCGYVLIVIIPQRTTAMYMNISKQGMLVQQAITVSFVIKLAQLEMHLEFTMYDITAIKNKTFLTFFV